MTAPMPNNPFFAALAVSQSKPASLSPVQKLYSLKDEMRELADAGDIKGWREIFPRLEALLKTIKFNPNSKMEWETEIKKLELTLLLNAGDLAKRQGEDAQKKAAVAEHRGDRQGAEEWSARAKKYLSFGEHLRQELLGKTQLETLG